MDLSEYIDSPGASLPFVIEAAVSLPSLVLTEADRSRRVPCGLGSLRCALGALCTLAAVLAARGPLLAFLTGILVSCCCVLPVSFVIR